MLCPDLMSVIFTLIGVVGWIQMIPEFVESASRAPIRTTLSLVIKNAYSLTGVYYHSMRHRRVTLQKLASSSSSSAGGSASGCHFKPELLFKASCMT